jgi:hypothetical protein
MNHRRVSHAGVLGSIALALRCVTSPLLLHVSAVGLTAWAGRIDVVLIPLALSVPHADPLGLAVLSRERGLHRPAETKADT